MGLRSLAAIALCASVLFGSTAFATPGTYLSGGLGFTLASDGDMDGNGRHGEAEFDTGYVVQGAFGHGYQNGVRAEVELAYRDNDFDTVEISNHNYSASGDINTVSVMLNGYYDFKIAASFTPYLGAGIGFAVITIDDLKAAGIDLADDDDTVFAYQLIAGVEIPISATASIDVAYRYFATSDPDFGNVDLEYSTHNFTAGVRLYF